MAERDVEAGLLATLVVALSGAAAVGPVLLVTTLLASKRGRPNATGFLAGYFGTYTAMATLMVAADLNVGSWTSGDAGRAGPMVLVVFGLGLLVLGMRTARLHADEGSSGIAPEVTGTSARPKTALIDRATPARTLGVGAAVAIVNVKNLALFLTAVAVLQASQLSQAEKLVAAPLVALIFCLTSFVPLVIDVVAPRRSERLLTALRHAAQRHGRRLARWLPWIVGAFFLARGVRGLA